MFHRGLCLGGLGTHISPPLFSPLPEEPQTDIGLPRERLSRAKEIKERKKILRENHQNAEMERAARLRTGQCPAPPFLLQLLWVSSCCLCILPLSLQCSFPSRMSGLSGRGPVARSTSSAWPNTAGCSGTCSRGPPSPPGLP